MMIATPAFAQGVAPADVHNQHSRQGGKTGHDMHEGHDMSGGRCDKGADGKMACCEKMKVEGKAKAPAADPHAGHGTGQH
ncbi:hypothetical protein ACFFV8_00535 [Sphingobium indicum]|uniref:hypothetical protein n=1 Tax=Sphingobium TaxID=165695 RepID=UPI001112A7D1|nr:MULTISPECIES: hypothetical protein [unclassified Sphingobium]